MPPDDGMACNGSAVSSVEGGGAHPSPEHRRRLGQYFTPPGIAAWMADWVIQPSTRSVLDPAVGTGALLSPVFAHPLLPGSARVDAWDLDPVILETCRNTVAAASASLTLHTGDFLGSDVDGSYDAIVCNPPYVRHRTLQQRQALYGAFEQQLGVRLSRFSNSYVLFILKIATLLSRQGRAAILTPVDFLNANFGSPIKSFLLRENILDGILVFEKATLVFDDANVAACIVLLRRDRTADDPVRFVRVPSEAELRALEALPQSWSSSYPTRALSPERKWLHLAPGSGAVAPLVRQRGSVPLEQLAAVRRGIATGANDFFTLTAAECEQYGLLAECRPCITKASHAPHLEFCSSNFDTLRNDGAKVYLLDVRAEVSAAAQAYLDEGLRRGVQRRYLTRHRNPWYATEQRPTAPLWVTTFSRTGFRFVLNDAGVANLTAFHGLYPVVDDHEWLLMLAAFLNSGAARIALAQHQRLYGSGLGKLEPLDVAKLPVIDPEEVPQSAREEIVALYTSRCRNERVDLAEARHCREALDRIWAELSRDLPVVGM